MRFEAEQQLELVIDLDSKPQCCKVQLKCSLKFRRRKLRWYSFVLGHCQKTLMNARCCLFTESIHAQFQVKQMKPTFTTQRHVCRNPIGVRIHSSDSSSTRDELRNWAKKSTFLTKTACGIRTGIPCTPSRSSSTVSEKLLLSVNERI